MSHRKDHIVITPLSGLMKKAHQGPLSHGAVVEPFDWMLLSAKKRNELADDMEMLHQEEQERRKNNIEKLIQIERNAKARIKTRPELN